jgi:hypothetical protein
MKQAFKKTALALACAGGMAAAMQAEAANWLMLQGTEPAAAAGRAYVWGFIQAQYQKDNSEGDDSGAENTYVPPMMMGPNLTSQQGFTVNRARIGVRGTGMPIDPKVNYFLLAEFANNATTAANEGSTMISDASITFNHIKGARVRTGLFKYPGAEEGYQAVHVMDYINFTEVSNQMLLERFPNAEFTDNNDSDPDTAGYQNPTLDQARRGDLNQFDKPVGAFRDVGVQVFDAFDLGGGNELSYAVMVGNGNGLNFADNDDKLDKYAYLSYEMIYGGEGARREGLKLFAWKQTGTRLLDNTDDGDHNPEEFDRNRSGFGVKYLKGNWRATAEYMKGEGMIWVGPDKPLFDQNGVLDQDGSCQGATKPSPPAPTPGLPNDVPCQAADGSEGKAKGWYVEGGWYIPNTNWELDLRYDIFYRLVDDPGPTAPPANAGRSFESVWKTKTFGVQYHFNKKTRYTFNYQVRDVESPDWPSDTGPNAVMDNIGNRWAMQVTHIF